jgi:hypothetical protein
MVDVDLDRLVRELPGGTAWSPQNAYTSSGAAGRKSRYQRMTSRASSMPQNIGPA